MPLFRSAVPLAFLCPLVSTFAFAQPSSQSLNLIPVPREVRAGAVQPLSSGVQITCASPCATEDAFAIDDLKTYLTSQGVSINPTSPVNLLVVRYGSPISKSIYRDATQPSAEPPADFPAPMKPEGYVILPDGKGLAITAATGAGIFYALQTVKQLDRL